MSDQTQRELGEAEARRRFGSFGSDARPPASNDGAVSDRESGRAEAERRFGKN